MYNENFKITLDLKVKERLAFETIDVLVEHERFSESSAAPQLPSSVGTRCHKKHLRQSGVNRVTADLLPLERRA